MPVHPQVELPQAEIVRVCRRHGVRELSLFGSAARGEMRPDSDYDFLVDFEPAARPGLLGLAALSRELSEVLHRRADVAIREALKPAIRRTVEADARVVYAA